MFYINRRQKTELFADHGFKVFLLKPYRLLDTSADSTYQDYRGKTFYRNMFAEYTNFYDSTTYEILPFNKWKTEETPYNIVKEGFWDEFDKF